MSLTSERLQTAGNSPARDAFSKRNFWHEDPSPDSFTRVRCMCTAGHFSPQPFATLERPPIARYSDTALHGETSRETNYGLLTLNGEREDSVSSLEDDEPSLELSLEKEEMLIADGSPPQTCTVCGKLFRPDDMVVLFESERFHSACFCCGQCGDPVDPSQQFLVLDDGSPLCTQCSPVCYVCSEKICNKHVAVLNRDFHEDCLKCAQCDKQFATMSKVYACNGEPCCAECITPVFDETWSPRSSAGSTFTERRRGSLVRSTSTSLCGSMSAAESPGHHALSPKLETLSRAVSDLPSAKRFHSLLRPSFSAPSISNDHHQTPQKLSLSSLKAVLYDELGVSLFMNFCVDDCSIELVVFWLDVEHFKHFDGDTDDMKVFAHHIMLKYIGYYAELPVGLPKRIEDQIVADMQKASSSQEIFMEAQEYVYAQMEKTLLSRFLQSHDGQKYLEALVSRDIDRRQKNGETTVLQVAEPMKATVTSFDKRHLNTKFYVYEIMVEMEDTQFVIYRRYNEFSALHQELKSSFPEEQFPTMPKKVFFGRSQTRSVAQQRMKDLQTYLQGVLSMPPAVSQNRIIQQFLTQTPSDREDELFNKRMKESQAAIY